VARRADKSGLSFLPIAVDERIAFRRISRHPSFNLTKRDSAPDCLVIGDAQTAQALLQANGAERYVVFDMAKEIAKSAA
jgi:hypothetical protein